MIRYHHDCLTGQDAAAVQSPNRHASTQPSAVLLYSAASEAELAFKSQLTNLMLDSEGKFRCKFFLTRQQQHQGILPTQPNQGTMIVTLIELKRVIIHFAESLHHNVIPIATILMFDQIETINCVGQAIAGPVWVE